MKILKKNGIFMFVMIVCLNMVSFNMIAQNQRPARSVSTVEQSKSALDTYKYFDEWLNRNKTSQSSYYNQRPTQPVSTVEQSKSALDTYKYFDEWLNRNKTSQNSCYNQGNNSVSVYYYDENTNSSFYKDGVTTSSYSGRSRAEIQMDLNKAKEFLSELKQCKADADMYSIKASYTTMIIEQQKYIRELELELIKAKE